MILILKVIIDFNNDDSNFFDSGCHSDNEFDLEVISSFMYFIVN